MPQDHKPIIIRTQNSPKYPYPSTQDDDQDLDPDDPDSGDGLMQH